jgi:hypothetical protein
MLAKDNATRDTLRMLISEIKNMEMITELKLMIQWFLAP